MERIKRQQTDTINDYNNNNKKLKFEPSIITINVNKSLLDDLANEIFYEIFEYLDIYHVYKGFFNLNKRFENLLLYSNLPIQINISTISKLNFERYYKHIILPNKHRINILRLSNPFTVDIVFSPPRLISKFVQLERLILDHINAKYLHNILRQAILLPKLHSLILTLTEYSQYPSQIFIDIFHLPKLKSCQITYQSKDEQNPSSIFLYDYQSSPIEYLTINSRFPYDSLDNILICLPKLRHLSINCLVNTPYSDIVSDFISSKYLKSIAFKLDGIPFDRLEKLFQDFFGHIEVLRLTVKYRQAYLDAKRWEVLIKSYLPNLRIFDINYTGSVRNTDLTYHDLINQFHSSFWIEKQWFFTHQHDWLESLDRGIFYSTDPYRRKDYKFYWEFDGQICSYIQERNLHLVKHVQICSKRATNTSKNYFPNATELTIKNHFKTPDDSISTTLNRVVRLKQLTKLVITPYHFPFDEIIKLLCLTLDLHTLKLDRLFIYGINIKLIQESDAFQYVSKINKIKNLEIRASCSLEEIQLIVHLFPKLEYLKIQMDRKEIGQIMHYLLSKSNQQTHHLVFLCIAQIPKICLKELNLLIKSENLLHNYFIKYLNRDLYLWW